MEIQRDIFECAANSLDINELKVTLNEYNINFANKDKKYEIINKLLNLIDEEKMSEDLYLAIKTKAYSQNNDCNEGFYYQYLSENIDFNYDKFLGVLSKYVNSEEKSKYGANTYMYSISGLINNKEEFIVNFTLKKETKLKKFDQIDETVMIIKELITADVEINYNDSIVYIKSKNFNNSKCVKFFLEKILNDLRIDKSLGKIKLHMPKFDGQIVDKWARDEKVDIKGISSMTVHMLDLLSEFDKESNNFTGYCMKKIYFGNEVINATEKKRIEGSIFFGDDIEECLEISECILKGKKINGFELLVDYSYFDEALGNDPEIIQVPVTILQESSTSVRIAISKDLDTVEKNILREIYIDIRKVFLAKLALNKISNTDQIKNFITRAKELFGKKGETADSNTHKAVTL